MKRNIYSEPECPACALSNAVVFDSRDWAIGRRDAWIYGIVAGWDDASFPELQARYKWGAEDIARLKRQRARFVAAFPCVADSDLGEVDSALAAELPDSGLCEQGVRAR